MSSDQPMDSKTIEDTKQQIRGLVSEIAQLSKSDITPEEYYAAFLQRIVQALAAVGGAIWLLGKGRKPELAYQINISDTLLDSESDEAQRHLKLLNYVVARNEPQLTPPLSGAGDERAGGNPTRYLLVLAPLRTDESVEGVVEIFQRPDSQPVTQRGYLKFLLQMCELAGEWLKTRKLKQLGDRHSLWEQADHFSRLVHDSLDLRECSYMVANEGRRLIGCDRVSVAIAKGSKCEIEAVSGQDTLENRSNIIHLLSQLASRVVATGEPLWYDGLTEDLPPQVENALEAYVDESYTKTITVLPLRQPKQYYEVSQQESARTEAEIEDNTTREIIGALIIEQIEHSMPRALLEPRADLVYEHSARALSNAMEHNNLFLMPVWRAIGKASWMVKARTLPKTLIVVALVLVAIASLFVIPGNFNIEGNGSLQPAAEHKRDVFAQVDGVVTTVLKGHGDTVEAGDPICILKNTELTLQQQQLQGDLLSTQEQLRGVRDSLIRNAATLSKEEEVRLSGQQSQLIQKERNLTAQLKTLEEQIDRLTVTAPISGEIITWDAKKLLENRPVQKGQVMVTVADTAKDWELEVHVLENRMGHIHNYMKDNNKSAKELEASYILSAAPGETKKTTVSRIHNSTEMDQEEGHTITVRLGPLSHDDLPIEPRPGASVTVDIHCGRAPVGYCWFHEAWEWVQKYVLF